jgi:hypothetical protein
VVDVQGEAAADRSMSASAADENALAYLVASAYGRPVGVEAILEVVRDLVEL